MIIQQKEFQIYIPHWLDSMQELLQPNVQGRAHLHSTLVRFYGYSKSYGRESSVYLHSTLVRFYGTISASSLNKANKFTFHTG